ncbi:MAG: hypothetical protein RL238_3633 [Actinomycetota bacterium]
MTRIRRMAALAAVALVLPLVTIGASTSTAAALDPTGSISGTVTLGADGVEGLTMTLTNLDTNSSFSGPTTGPNGEYTFAALEPGNYLVSAEGGADAYPTRYHPTAKGILEATTIVVGADAVTDVDIVYPPGTISGTVYWRGGPLEGANVSATATDDGMNSSGAVTGPNGEYTIRFLDPGTFLVGANEPTAGAVIHGIESSADFVTLSPAALHVANIDMTIGPGIISGVVVDTNGNPVDLASVMAQQLMPDVLGNTHGFGTPLSLSGDGTFVIRGLAENTYRLTGTRYTSPLRTTPIAEIVIGPGNVDVNGLVLQFPQPSSISGHVLQNGTGVEGVTVYALAADGNTVTSTTTGPGGAYTLADLNAGNLKVFMSNPDGSGPWYHPGVGDSMSAGTIPLGTGQDVTDIDITLPSSGTISGVVTDGTHGIEGVTVQVWRPSIWWMAAASTVTGPDGSYSIAGLPSGEALQVQFSPPTGSGYLPEWYDDAADRNAAATVTLSSGETRTDVSAVLTQAASLSGRVVAADTGLGVHSQVVLYRPDLGSYVNISNLDGTFTLSDVVADDYVLYAIPGPFGPSDYAPEYWRGAIDLASATPITLQGGDALTDFVITVDVGLTVSGRVTDPLDNAVAGVTVYADTAGYPPGFSVGNVQAQTAADGTYTLRGLNPGSYPIRFEAPLLSGLLSEYHPGAYDASGQVPLTVTTSLTGVNAQLERGIFGTAVLRDSNGLLDSTTVFAAGPATCVSPFVFDIGTISCGPGGTFQSFAPDGAGPGWRVGPMAPGTYTTRAARLGSTSGDVVVFTVGIGESFACDLAFPGAGTSSCTSTTPQPTGLISGRVTGPDGLGVGGVVVTAYLTNDAAIPTQVTTDEFGYYEMGGVAAGSYRIRFEPPIGRTDVIGEYWSAAGGAPGFAGADDVTVTANATTTGISARLDPASGGIAVITDGGVPRPLASGRAVVACPASTTYDLSQGFFSCADGTPVVFGQPNGSVGNIQSAFATLGAGSWKLRAVELVFFPTRLGPEATITIAAGDSFDCTLPLDAATPSCTVAPGGPSDGDGITPEVEGDAPNAGDGNNDGTPDAVQPEVTSLADPDSGYITLAVDQPVGATTPEYTLANVELFDPATPPPSNVTPQTGVVGFDVVGLPVAATATVDVYLPAEANQYWKYDPATNTWDEATELVEFDPANPLVIGGVERWHATITLTDGGAGDQDGVANGVIVDPGLWALGASDVTPPTISCPAAPSIVLNASGATLTATVSDDTDATRTISVALPSGALGGNTVTVATTDAAGNPASVNCGYQVGVVVQGFHSPINTAAINSVKGGQTVPVKWRTVDANGAPVADPATFVRLRSAAVTQACEPGVSIVSVGDEVSTVGNGLKYLGNGEWQLNWKTSSTMKGCRVLVLDTVGGGTTGATFLVR